MLRAVFITLQGLKGGLSSIVIPGFLQLQRNLVVAVGDKLLAVLLITQLLQGSDGFREFAVLVQLHGQMIVAALGQCGRILVFSQSQK